MATSIAARLADKLATKQIENNWKKASRVIRLIVAKGNRDGADNEADHESNHEACKRGAGNGYSHIAKLV